MKGPQTSVTHLIPGAHAIEYQIERDIFLKTSFGPNISQRQLIAEVNIRRSFLITCSENFINFPEHTQ